MHWVWTVLAVLAIILVLLSLLPVQLQIRYVKEGERNHLSIRLRALFGLLNYTIEMPVLHLLQFHKKWKIIAIARSGPAGKPKKRRSRLHLSLETVARLFQIQRELADHLHRFLHHFRKLTKSLHIVRMDWQTELGTGDAALTGTAAGLCWSVKGIAVGLLAHFCSLRRQPVLAVHPRFQELMLRTSFDCIIRVWPGQAMLAGIQVGLYMLREGRTSWRIIRSKV